MAEIIDVSNIKQKMNEKKAELANEVYIALNVIPASMLVQFCVMTGDDFEDIIGFVPVFKSDLKAHKYSPQIMPIKLLPMQPPPVQPTT